MDKSLIRNFSIIAHIDHGKSTLADRILDKTATLDKRQIREQILDDMELERERGITIKASAVRIKYKAHDSRTYIFNLIDTPGHVDFTIEVERSLRVLDGAVAVFDAVAGVEPQSETVWRQADKYNVPRVAFINKMDRVGADFFMSTKSMIERLGAVAVPIQIPIGKEEDFIGTIDIIKMKANLFGEDTQDEKVVETEIPEDILPVAVEYRDKMLETLADFDETIMGKYLSGEDIEPDIIKAAIRKGTIGLKMTPVLCGAAFKNKGVQTLLDVVIDYLPCPLDIPPIKGINTKTGEETVRKVSDKEPFAALAFKITTEIGRASCRARV